VLVPQPTEPGRHGSHCHSTSGTTLAWQLQFEDSGAPDQVLPTLQPCPPPAAVAPKRRVMTALGRKLPQRWNQLRSVPALTATRPPVFPSRSRQGNASRQAGSEPRRAGPAQCRSVKVGCTGKCEQELRKRASTRSCLPKELLGQRTVRALGTSWLSSRLRWQRFTCGGGTNRGFPPPPPERPCRPAGH